MLFVRQIASAGHAALQEASIVDEKLLSEVHTAASLPWWAWATTVCIFAGLVLLLCHEKAPKGKEDEDSNHPSKRGESSLFSHPSAFFHEAAVPPPPQSPEATVTRLTSAQAASVQSGSMTLPPGSLSMSLPPTSGARQQAVEIQAPRAVKSPRAGNSPTRGAIYSATGNMQSMPNAMTPPSPRLAYSANMQSASVPHTSGSVSITMPRAVNSPRGDMSPAGRDRSRTLSSGIISASQPPPPHGSARSVSPIKPTHLVAAVPGSMSMPLSGSMLPNARVSSMSGSTTPPHQAATVPRSVPLSTGSLSPSRRVALPHAHSMPAQAVYQQPGAYQQPMATMPATMTGVPGAASMQPRLTQSMTQPQAQPEPGRNPNENWGLKGAIDNAIANLQHSHSQSLESFGQSSQRR